MNIEQKSEPRIVTPQEARRLLDDGKIAPFARLLAHTVATEPQRNAETQRAAQLLGEIVSRDAEWICEIAGLPMPEDGDADYELAWDLVRAMPTQLKQIAEELDRLFSRAEKAEAALARVKDLGPEQTGNYKPRSWKVEWDDLLTAFTDPEGY